MDLLEAEYLEEKKLQRTNFLGNVSLRMVMDHSMDVVLLLSAVIQLSLYLLLNASKGPMCKYVIFGKYQVVYHHNLGIQMERW